MNTLIFNKNSWHFILAANVAGYRCDTDKENLCSYSKFVIKGMLMLMFAGIIIALMGSMFFHLIFGVMFSIMLGTLFFTGWGIVAATILGIGCLTITSKYLIDKICDYKYEHHNSPSGFIINSYKGWKEKYCMKIIFVENNGK